MGLGVKPFCARFWWQFPAWPFPFQPPHPDWGILMPTLPISSHILGIPEHFGSSCNSTWSPLALESWIGVKVNNCSSKRCGDPRTAGGVLLSLFVFGKGIFFLIQLGAQGWAGIFPARVVKASKKNWQKSKNLHFRPTLLEVPHFAAKLCYTSRPELHFVTEPLLEPKA